MKRKQSELLASYITTIAKVDHYYCLPFMISVIVFAVVAIAISIIIVFVFLCLRKLKVVQYLNVNISTLKI